MQRPGLGHLRTPLVTLAVLAVQGVLGAHASAAGLMVVEHHLPDRQGCVLTCHASPSLGHLYAPLVTLARTPSGAHSACAARAAARTVASLLAAPPALAVCMKCEHGALGGSRGCTRGKDIGSECGWGSGVNLLLAGGGVLTVVETRILVGACAVHGPVDSC